MSLRTIGRCALLGAAIAFAAPSADAALTSSEKALIREYYANPQTDNAPKVRSLVARTDLTQEESAAALAESVAAVPFSDVRGNFLKAVVFGEISMPSRPVLVLATVKALLARADTVYQRYVGGLDHEPKAIAELVAIYGWVDAAIANAGKPTTSEHDPNAGIPPATYEEASKLLRDHVDTNARWLKGDGAVPPAMARLRAQAQVTLIDLLPDGTMRRVDAADRLGLKGARRAMLTDSGVLLADTGRMDDAAIERVRQLLVKLPGVRTDLGLIAVGEGPGPALHARGQVVNVADTNEPYPFPKEAAPAGYDPLTSAIAHELAVVVAMRALDNRWSQLRLQADRDTIAINTDPSRLLGRPRAPSVENVIGAALHALLVDAPKTLDLAVARAAAGKPETVALVSDALGVLAAPLEGAQDPRSNAGGRVELGKGNGNGWTTATNLRLAPNGAAIGLKLEGHTWAIDRASPSYVILGVRKDGQTVATGPGVKLPEPPKKPDKPEPPKKPAR